MVAISITCIPILLYISSITHHICFAHNALSCNFQSNLFMKYITLKVQN